MPYATQADLLQRMSMADLVQLTDDAKTGQVNAAIVAAELEEASGKVDTYCRNRYATPLQQSDSVTGITRDIATYFLFSRRPGKMRDDVRQRYEDAMQMLKDVSAGKASFDQPVAATPQSSNAGPVKPLCTGQRMTEKDLQGFV